MLYTKMFEEECIDIILTPEDDDTGRSQQIYKKVNEEMAKTILRKIADEDQINELTVRIAKDAVDEHIEHTLGNESITIVGIMTLCVIDVPVGETRARMEFVLLCVLADLSGRYLVRHPGMPLKDRMHTDQSMLAVVSLASFRMYQSYVMGLKILQKAYGYSDQETIKSSFAAVDNSSVIIETDEFGVIRLPTREEKDALAEMTQFTTDIFKAMNLKVAYTREGNRYIDPFGIKIPRKILLEQIEV